MTVAVQLRTLWQPDLGGFDAQTFVRPAHDRGHRVRSLLGHDGDAIAVGGARYGGTHGGAVKRRSNNGSYVRGTIRRSSL